ncbi:MAG: NAAT family transporter [Elusimicrobia bacterium]|nr:NAAT family transporter [Elusimicrobiota bacterium]
MSLVQYTLLTAVPLMAIINPLAAVPVFLAITPNDSVEARLSMALRGCLVCGGILVVFAALGTHIFKVFGISLSSFRIAGGLILLLMALDSLQAERGRINETEEELREGAAKDDVSVTPLGVPLLAGPGAISSVIVFESQAQGLAQTAALYLVLAAITAVCYLTFWVFLKGVRRVNPIAMNIVTRLMGLLLAATGVEFILSGLKAAGVVN